MGKPEIASLEVKSSFDDSKYYLQLSGHIDVIFDLELDFTDNMNTVIRGIKDAYMAVHTYDEMGSSVRRFINDYIRIIHITERSTVDEIHVFSREQLCDHLLNRGWTMIGFACYGENVVVEKWYKDLRK